MQPVDPPQIGIGRGTEWIERHGLFQRRFGLIELAQLEVSTTQIIVGRLVVGLRLQDALDQLDRGSVVAAVVSGARRFEQFIRIDVRSPLGPGVPFDLHRYLLVDIGEHGPPEGLVIVTAVRRQLVQLDLHGARADEGEALERVFGGILGVITLQLDRQRKPRLELSRKLHLQMVFGAGLSQIDRLAFLQVVRVYQSAGTEGKREPRVLTEPVEVVLLGDMEAIFQGRLDVRGRGDLHA